MTSKTSKQLAATAALAACLMMMGGTAFASTVGDASEQARSTVADVRNQIHRDNAAETTGLVPRSVGDASTFARNNAADVRNQVHRHQW
jgi:hypothetical protein